MRYLSDFFPQSTGAAGGVVSALGGLGGFLLPIAGNAVRIYTGSIYLQVVPLALLGAGALAVQTIAVFRRGKPAEIGGSLSALASAHDPAVVPAQATVGKAGLVDKVQG